MAVADEAITAAVAAPVGELPRINRLELEDPRKATIAAHAYLRELIFSNVLPAGLIISQVELARTLGVSRTPLREALRMLQEEGLIEGEPNRRCRVAGFFAEDLDALCASRIMLEALAMRITLPQISRAETDDLTTTLDTMEAMARTVRLDGRGPTEEWRREHRVFHRAMLRKAPGALLEQIDAQTERSERYFLTLVHGRPFGSIAKAGEHRAMVTELRAGNFGGVIVANAHHRARTALAMLMEVALGFEPVAVRAALRLIGAEWETAASASARTAA